MSARAAVLAERREALLARSATLRAALREDGARVAASVGAIDRLVARANSRSGRMLLGAAAALLLLRRPRRLLRLALRIAPFVPAFRPWIGRWFRARRERDDPAAVSPPP